MNKRLFCIISVVILFFGVFITVKVNRVEATNNFTPRLTEPSTTDKYWINVSAGGLNKCIKIGNTNSALPNCVGYAWGRAYEILGSEPKLSTSHAKKWYNYNINSKAYSYGKTPKLGAIMCWSGGDYGHVAVVEKISGNSMTVSDSNFNGERFRCYTDTIAKQESRQSGFQGYIYIRGDVPDTPSHTHNYSSLTAIEGAHPHKEYRRCTYSGCKAFIYTGKIGILDGCSYCLNHVHDYSPSTALEGAHPHKEYRRCSYVGCNAFIYTGKKGILDGCSYCLNHVHEYSPVTAFEGAHPHKEYRRCSYVGCNAFIYTGKTKYVDGCSYCLKEHDHNYSPSTAFEGEHPHKEYRRCTYSGCKAFIYTGNTGALASCSYCTKIDSNYPVPIKGYTISTEKTLVYDSVNGSAKTNKIYDADLCTIDAIYVSGWCHVVFPLDAGGTDNGYVKTSAFFDPSVAISTIKTPKQISTYQRSNLGTTTGYVDSGCDVYVVGKTSSATQIIYPLTGGGYKIGWVKSSDLSATYTISYNANGGSGAPVSQTKKHGTNLTLSSTVPTRTGYTFQGWATTADATSAAYQPGGNFSIELNTTLYAVWKKDSTLDVDGNSQQIIVEEIVANPGSTVDVRVYVKNNPGITSMKLKVKYDSNLTLTQVVYNEEEIGGNFQLPERLTSPVTLNWYNGTSNSNGDWTFATLTFRVKEDVASGTECPISITYNPDDLYNIDEENIKFEVQDGKIVIAHHIPGDVNGDGKVNNKDLTRLFQYLSDWDVEVENQALDINGDGKVNNKDLTRLFQYLSDWDVEIY